MARDTGGRVAAGNEGVANEAHAAALAAGLPPAPARPSLEALVERAAADPERLAHHLRHVPLPALAARLRLSPHRALHLLLCWAPLPWRWEQATAELAAATGADRAGLQALLRERCGPADVGGRAAAGGAS
jgi:hypothetical protein